MKRYTLSIEHLLAEAGEIVAALPRSRAGRRRAAVVLIEFLRRSNVRAEAAADGLKVVFDARSRGAADDLQFAAACHLAMRSAEKTALHWVRHAERRHSK